ncbi:MAG: nuclear transport factor 2 family protein [Saprospiraceae bacterium]
MSNSNQKIVDAFFASYGKNDMAGIRNVVADDAVWYFIGRHPLAGIKNGVQEIAVFFDAMGKIMGSSNPTIEKLIVGENGDYFFECSHIKTNRPDGINVDHHVSVLWTIKDGKIVEGRHFFADPVAIDEYFNDVVKGQE